MSLRRRRVLLGLATAVAVLVALPAAASATITPALTLDQSTGTTAGTSQTVGFDAKFAPSSGDSVKDFTLTFPSGLLSNTTLDGGACVASAPPASGTPPAACQIGTSTVTLSSGASLPLTLYLVAPPNPADAAGVAAYLGTAQIPPTADSTLGPNGLSTTFTGLPNLGVSEINTVLAGLRMPSSCPTPAANVTVTADSQNDSTPVSATAPLTVTGCDSVPYSPNLTAAIGVDSSTGGAELKADVTQAADEAASKAISIKFPSGLTPNAAALVPCVTGTPCTIGTATATSPLMPSTLNGTVTLGGTIAAPTFAITFPAPVNLTINGAVDLANGAVTFSDVPDVPLTDLSLDITGVNGQRAFITDCKPASVTGSFTGQGGQTHTATAPITFTGTCPPPASTGGGTGGGGTGGGGTGGGGTGGTGTGTGTGPSSPQGSNPTPKVKPKLSGSVAGLASGHPKLTLKATAGSGTKIASVAAGLPRGLKFSRSAIVSHKVCTKKGKQKKCTTTLRVKGLRIVGGSVKTVALKSGRLVITLKKAVTRVTITATGPLVTESKSLQTKVKQHKAGTLRFTIKLTAPNRATTSLTMKLKAH